MTGLEVAWLDSRRLSWPGSDLGPWPGTDVTVEGIKSDGQGYGRPLASLINRLGVGGGYSIWK